MPLYEIHISVDLKTPEEEIKWIFFCRDQGYNRARHLLAQGDYPIQNMISSWNEHANDEDAITFAKTMASEISPYFTINRIKVEAMLKDYSSEDEKEKSPPLYWEFHFKLVNQSIHNELDDLRLWIRNHLDCLDEEVPIGISVNSLSSPFPIITLRLYNKTKEQALIHKESLLIMFEGVLYIPSSKQHDEVCIYDSNPDLDKNWFIPRPLSDWKMPDGYKTLTK